MDNYIFYFKTNGISIKYYIFVESEIFKYKNDCRDYF